MSGSTEKNTGGSGREMAEDHRLVAERRHKLDAMRADGFAFPNDRRRTAMAAALHANFEGHAAESLEKESIEVQIGGRLMYDNIWRTSDEFGPNVTTDSSFFRRIRLAVSGKIYKIFGFKVQIDFAKSTLSISVAGMAAQSTTTSGCSRRGLSSWMLRETSSLPTPLSP